MHSIEEITKIIANIMALSAIPTLGITVAKYFYEKNKDMTNRIKNGYMPLYEFFFREKYSKEYIRNELSVLTRSTGDSLYELIGNKTLVDKSLLPFKLVKLLCEYEFYMDIINTGIEYLLSYEKMIMENDTYDELQDIQALKETISNYYSFGVVTGCPSIEIPSFEGVLAEDYISMINNSLKRVEMLYNEIEKTVFRVIGRPKYFPAKNFSASLFGGSRETYIED